MNLAYQGHVGTRPALEPSEAATIRACHRLVWWRNLLKIPVIYAVAVALGWGILAAPHWALRVPLQLAMACTFAAIGVLLHDGAHGLLFPSTRVNRWLSRALATTLGIAFTQFRYAHLFHHRYSMTDRDRDRYFYVRNLFFAIMFGGRALYESTVAGLRTATRREVMVYCAELAAVLAWFGGWAGLLYWQGWLWEAVLVFVIPFLLFPPLLIARLLLEHYDCSFDDEYTMTRTIHTNPITRWLWSNVNFHTIHHFWPQIPWYHLPRAHAALAEHLLARGAVESRGYLATLLGALRRHGFARPSYWQFPEHESVRLRRIHPSLRRVVAAPERTA